MCHSLVGASVAAGKFHQTKKQSIESGNVMNTEAALTHLEKVQRLASKEPSGYEEAKSLMMNDIAAITVAIPNAVNPVLRHHDFDWLVFISMHLSWKPNQPSRIAGLEIRQRQTRAYSMLRPGAPPNAVQLGTGAVL